MNCPRCDNPATGKFCSSCGATLEPTDCPSCGARPDAADRFCNRCGTFLQAGAAVQAAAPGGSRADGPNIAWWTAGGLLVVLILVLARPLLQGGSRPEPAITPAGAAAPAGVGTSAVDLASMTPREAADRLFNRVMNAVEQGDTVEVTNFLPMAVASYDRAQPLDADGVFHLALLQLTGLQFEGARAVADAALEQYPGHLLLLSVAAEAARQLGDDAGAAGYYQLMVDGWDAQIASGLAEYAAHASTVSQIENDARSYLESR